MTWIFHSITYTVLTLHISLIICRLHPGLILAINCVWYLHTVPFSKYKIFCVKAFKTTYHLGGYSIPNVPNLEKIFHNYALFCNSTHTSLFSKIKVGTKLAISSCAPPLFCWGGWARGRDLSLQPNFKKRGLDCISIFRGGLLGKRGGFFRGGGRAFFT